MFIRKIFTTAIWAVTLLFAHTATAELTLDSERSSVSLISYKVLAGAAASVSERHSFTDVSGSVDDYGMAIISISLNSIETGIPIRNERLAKFVFETDKYPNAIISAKVPKVAMSGRAQMMELDINLDFHGVQKELTVPVLISRSDTDIIVTSTQPVILDATTFELATGIGKLAELAKLLHIPTTVPVSFTMVFSR